MSYWNYRIMERESGGMKFYEINEVYYNDEDRIEGWTETGVGPFGHSLEELREVYYMLAEAFEKPVLIQGEIECVGFDIDLHEPAIPLDEFLKEIEGEK